MPRTVGFPRRSRCSPGIPGVSDTRRLLQGMGGHTSPFVMANARNDIAASPGRCCPVGCGRKYVPYTIVGERQCPPAPTPEMCLCRGRTWPRHSPYAIAPLGAANVAPRVDNRNERVDRIPVGEAKNLPRAQRAITWRTTGSGPGRLCTSHSRTSPSFRAQSRNLCSDRSGHLPGAKIPRHASMPAGISPARDDGGVMR